MKTIVLVSCFGDYLYAEVDAYSIVYESYELDDGSTGDKGDIIVHYHVDGEVHEWIQEVNVEYGIAAELIEVTADDLETIGKRVSKRT